MIRVTGKQDGRNRFIKITQEKFTFDQTGSRDIRAEGTWVIPITVTAERDPGAIIFHTLMDTKSQTIVISDIGKNDWIKVCGIHVHVILGFISMNMRTNFFLGKF